MFFYNYGFSYVKSVHKIGDVVPQDGLKVSVFI